MKKYPFRSLTEHAGWVKKSCERCDVDFWVIPSQENRIGFCSKLCKNETPEIRFWKLVDKNGPLPPGKEHLGNCWAWKGNTIEQYGYFKVEGENARAHRFSYKLHFGTIDETLPVIHLCNVRSCSRPEHLKQDTQLANIQQCVEDGRRADVKGEKAALALFTNEQVGKIREEAKTILQKELAKKYNTVPSVISNIVNFKTYKPIDNPPGKM